MERMQKQIVKYEQEEQEALQRKEEIEEENEALEEEVAKYE